MFINSLNILNVIGGVGDSRRVEMYCGSCSFIFEGDMFLNK